MQAHGKKIYLKLSVERNSLQKLQSIWGEKKRYQQVLLNLVQNGVKFTYSGGVELDLSLLTRDEQHGVKFDDLKSQTNTS